MAEVIATIWDFDKTLISEYMQQPLFDKYGVNAEDFWKECNSQIAKHLEAGLEVNKDTFYLNIILRYVRNGTFKGLNNKELVSYGTKMNFYSGVIDLFKEIKSLNDNERYKAYDIHFENYIVSTGLKKIIEGSDLNPLVEKIWGCEFIEHKGVIDEVAYSIDNTTKTRAIFEINKGVNIGPNKGMAIDVNTKIPLAQRRVKFENMIYIADGPSDVPAFSLVTEKKGATLAVYKPQSYAALCQADDLLKNGRVQFFAEANYDKGSTAYLWLMKKITDRANQIIEEKRATLQKYGAGTPRHLIND